MGEGRGNKKRGFKSGNDLSTSKGMVVSGQTGCTGTVCVWCFYEATKYIFYLH